MTKLNNASKKKRKNVVCRVLLIGVLVFLQIANLGYGKALANEITSTESSTGLIEKSAENSSMVQSKESQTESIRESDKTVPSSSEGKEKDTVKEKNPANKTSESKDQKKDETIDDGEEQEIGPKKNTYRASSTAGFVAEITGSAGVTYHLYSDGTAVLVDGKSVTGDYRLFANARYQEVVYRVTKIADNAFSHSANGKTNEKITGIDFSNSENLEEIGKQAFYGCTKIKTALDFSNCKKLTTIGEGAFWDCFELSGLEFGSHSVVKTIGKDAFRTCKKLAGTSIILPDSVREIGNQAFLIWDGPRFKRLQHKTVLEMDGQLPSLVSVPPPVTEEIKGYESAVDSSNDKTTLHKAAKWLDKDRTEAEIRIDYGSSFDRQAKLDVVFVLDHSGSMLNLADAVGTIDQENYKYPRSFLTNDVVNGATNILLNSSQSGYDNQVALTAFGGGERYLFRTNFSDDAHGIKEFLYDNPATTYNQTNYSAGLQGAIDTIEEYQKPGRIPVVIFISDGLPEGTGDIHGLNQAKILRDRGHRVYPIGIYGTGDENERRKNLENISYDNKTAYLAKDSAAFEKIMEDVLEDVVNSAVPLEIKLEDVLSKDFELSDESDAISISEDGGTASTSAGKISWDLGGCEQGVLHTMKLKVKLKAGTALSTSGVLPTNDSLQAEDSSIFSVKQPELVRYLAHHTFENVSFTGKELPEEIKELLPGSKGGFGDHETIAVTDVAKTTLRTKNGQWWEFVGWDANQKTIASTDVTFVGKWKYLGYEWSFIKQTSEGEGLKDAEFSLYQWSGQGVPTNDDLVTTTTLTEGKWTLLAVNSSQENGRVDFNVPYGKNSHYQLVETKTPSSYRQPDGQWRFTFDENGWIKDNKMEPIKGPSGEFPPAFESIKEGEFTGFLGVVNHAYKGALPNTGGFGRSSFSIGAFICWTAGMSGVVVWYFFNKKKK